MFGIHQTMDAVSFLGAVWVFFDYPASCRGWQKHSFRHVGLKTVHRTVFLTPSQFSRDNYSLTAIIKKPRYHNGFRGFSFAENLRLVQIWCKFILAWVLVQVKRHKYTPISIEGTLNFGCTFFYFHHPFSYWFLDFDFAPHHAFDLEILYFGGKSSIV